MPMEGAWRFEGAAEGPVVCISFGVHGNERAPITAGLSLVEGLSRGDVTLARGRLVLLLSNPRASAEDERWSSGGVDLNRCFHPTVLEREPELYEEGRAQEIAAFLDEEGVESLVDFHCTVEPGDRFMMHHAPVDDAPHLGVTRYLAGDVLLGDPKLYFGGVSLDERLSTRGRVGVCYETGWMSDPSNTPAAVRVEMDNLLAGLGLLAGPEPRAFDGKRTIQLYERLLCEGEGFRWSDGVGVNLQAIEAGTRLGIYDDGTPVVLEHAATLVFPKKKPELLERGRPMVYLARDQS